jgi:uncharacterized protein YjbI with pentapeptide repeats
MTRSTDACVDYRPINRARPPTGRALLLRRAIAFAVASLLHLIICFSANADGGCPKPAGPPGANYSGQTLSMANFSHRDLTNANFSSAHLTSPNFIGANLTGANFSSATIDTDTTNALTADFSFANLTKACFYQAKIGYSIAIGSRPPLRPSSLVAPVYFEYATLTCADFSGVSLVDEQNNDLAIFGESLRIDKDPGGDPNKLPCRTAFRSDPMNCQFIADWRWLDLDDANIGACLSQLRGRDFSGGKFRGVNFSGGSKTQIDLSGTHWQGAELSGANFNYDNLENADFSNAQLNLLSDPTSTRFGATLNLADLNNAVFKGADLSYASFVGATLTGSDVDLTGATLTGSNWGSATLSGVKLDGLKAWGADFAGAALNNTTLKNTDLGYNSFKATGTNTLDAANLTSASLCGATLDATILTCADLTKAHVLSANPPADCANANITTTPLNTPPPNGEYTTKTQGLSGQINCHTTCPDGNNGPCVSAAQWQSQTPAGTQCCTGKNGVCPPGKAPGKSCTTDCDCHSKHCDGGTCGTDADLVKALLREQTEPRH